MKLITKSRRAEGIFGELQDDQGNLLFYTLEHSYGTYSMNYMPKIPRGVYTCKRGEHKLLHMTKPFTTFEVTGVVGHTNILFHVGNYNEDSEGCILLGKGEAGNMVTQSESAFEEFMAMLDGKDEFTLSRDP